MEIEKLLALYMNILALENLLLDQEYTVIVDKKYGFRLSKDGHEENIGIIGWADPHFLTRLTDAISRFQAPKN